MINVSDDFKTSLRGGARLRRAEVAVQGQTPYLIKSDDKLQGFKIEAVGGFLQTTMQKITITALSKDLNLTDKVVTPKSGVKLANGQWQDITFNDFLITESTHNLETGISTFIGYDNMANFNTNYTPDGHSYPCTMGEFLGQICQKVGVGHAMGQGFVNSELEVPIDYYSKINGVTYRDILRQIAEVSATMAIISQNQLLLKPVWGSAVADSLTDTDMRKFKHTGGFGGVNALTLSRAPQEDNIAHLDSQKVSEDGLFEIKITNNELIDKRRQVVLPSIYQALAGSTYQGFEIDSIGLGYFETGDRLEVVSGGKTYNGLITSYSLDFKQGLSERLVAITPDKTVTNHNRTGDITKRLYNTEIVVDKQQQYIQSVVSDIETMEGVVNEKFSQITQNIEGITQLVQTAGGANLLKNSVFFALDEGGSPLYWQGFYLEHDTPSQKSLFYSSPDALAGGSISGHVGRLNGGWRQTVPVIVNQQYSFSCLIKNPLGGEALVRITNGSEQLVKHWEPHHIVSHWSEVAFEGFSANDNVVTVEVWGMTHGEFEITDIMLVKGASRQRWAQAGGELLNTMVNITEKGMIIKSSIYEGDYTAITPLEFSGYSVVNGVLTKVFSLNKETTEVEKLKARNELAMPPLKVLPITSGGLSGWAIVKMS